jgi:hypothetical protein
MRRLKRLLLLLTAIAVVVMCVVRYIMQHQPRRLATGLTLSDQETIATGKISRFSQHQCAQITWASNRYILLFRPTAYRSIETYTGNNSPQWSVERIDTISSSRKVVPFAANPGDEAIGFTASPDGTQLAWCEQNDSSMYTSTIDGAQVRTQAGVSPMRSDWSARDTCEYLWAPDGRHIVAWRYPGGGGLYSNDVRGNEPAAKIPLDTNAASDTDLIGVGKDEIRVLATDLFGYRNSSKIPAPTGPPSATITAYSAQTGRRLRQTRFAITGARRTAVLDWSLAPDGLHFAIVLMCQEPASPFARVLSWLHIKQKSRLVQALFIYGPGPEDVRKVYAVDPEPPHNSTIASPWTSVLREMPHITNVRWSPDGKHIAFTANSSIYVAPVE